MHMQKKLSSEAFFFGRKKLITRFQIAIGCMPKNVIDMRCEGGLLARKQFSMCSFFSLGMFSIEIPPWWSCARPKNETWEQVSTGFCCFLCRQHYNAIKKCTQSCIRLFRSMHRRRLSSTSLDPRSKQKERSFA